MSDLRQIFQGYLSQMENASTDETMQRQLVRDKVFDAVRTAIMEGLIAPDTRLTERELCEAFDISRTVVREVVRRLEAEKLVSVVPHSGLRVARLTRKHVHEIYEIRTELEAITVRSFLACATDEHIAEAQEFARKMLEAGAKGDKVGMAETMSKFLRFMTDVADNQIAAEMLDQLRSRVNMLRIYAMAEPGQLETGMEGVRAIIAGITARDIAAAERATRIYVRRSAEAVLRHMDRDG
ncbi:HTH-type transcriptional regulator McbR [Devosia equisanguinis]|uniref:HTH-type transcriptional regulator McbR n=2 Tax=Devosiaceae TaxID=2831106 RepID=A0A447I6W8_9HYPH|nr:MAG: hypothetical protein ABS74_17860 [Pelagibacterium sp. SCN 63-126]ODU85577.1 MAG: hypothetical protein ABT14_12350 [Pelagibacterium sp. SCN 63-17]OJX42240.1 MAG: hypothetical protein BGO80_11990 [Devosia sp. 63-57]VDS03280.1 HTH-type transcriptional regulator McbR [Devosia equisanguinis]